MSLWLLLAAHLIADFSLQPADWAEKKTQRFKYLARHAFVYAIAIIYGSVRIFGLDEQTRNWLTDLALTFPVEQILRYSLIFIIILDPASVYVKKLSIYVTGGTSGGHKKAPPVGSVIGK